ncbi:MAG: methylmalonyl Co-A mutase-associated GTPase MeaB [Bacteroidota bacterium]
MPTKRLHKSEYLDGIENGNRLILSRAITLIESKRKEDQELSKEILDSIVTNKTSSVRIGITGVPGVGKSTFIESFGSYLTNKLNKKTAVLSIDPSSQISKGSILGDKTRMERLSKNPRAFIRPSATGNSLGGVGAKTYEIIRLCEAAGFEIVLVETVGVGQSETVVKGMVDFFLLLMITGAGDDLQGIKRGIMEMADMIAITKADGNNLEKAQRTKTELKSALHFFPPKENNWLTDVEVCSALKGTNIESIWDNIDNFKKQMLANDWLIKNRKNQALQWMHNTIQSVLKEEFYSSQEIKKELENTELQVENGELSALTAAKKLLALFMKEA